MICQNKLFHIVKRSLSTQKPDIGQIFIRENVQKLLIDVTRFDESKIFATRLVPELKTPKLVFMTDEQLKKAKEDAYSQVKARLQMPPVMAANTSKPQVLSRDKDVVGYTKFKIMFIDISPGNSDRNRLMSVRESDGTLRYPNHQERSRLNHMFYPNECRPIDTPKLFEDKNLLDLLKRKEYLFVLNRACVQFEPDDPRYVAVTSKVYTYVDEKRDYDMLRSTRHFGPMCLFLAYNNRVDSIIREMLSKGFKEDAEKMTELCNICQNIEEE